MRGGVCQAVEGGQTEWINSASKRTFCGKCERPIWGAGLRIAYILMKFDVRIREQVSGSACHSVSGLP